MGVGICSTKRGNEEYLPFCGRCCGLTLATRGDAGDGDAYVFNNERSYAKGDSAIGDLGPELFVPAGDLHK